MSIFFHIACFAPLVPLLVGLLQPGANMKPHHKWFLVLMAFISLFSITGWVFAYLLIKNNLPFFHIYILIEFLFLWRIFFKILEWNIRSPLSIVISGSFVSFWVINVIWIDGLTTYPTIIHGVEAILLLILAISFFMKLLREKKVARPARTFSFWLSTGVIMFFSSNFLLFVFSGLIANIQREAFMAIWNVHAILTILLYLLYTLAFLWIPKTTKLS